MNRHYYTSFMELSLSPLLVTAIVSKTLKLINTLLTRRLDTGTTPSSDEYVYGTAGPGLLQVDGAALLSDIQYTFTNNTNIRI